MAGTASAVINAMRIKIAKKNDGLKGGFTLTELLVALGIFLIVMVVLAGFGKNIFDYNSIIQGDLVAEIEAKQALEKISKELRSIFTSDIGSYAIAEAGTSTITFYSDTNNDGRREKIRYFVSSSTLKRGSITPSGSPLSYNPANEKFSEVLHSVKNDAVPLFEYYDDNYSGTENPLPSPVVTSNIRHIKINFIVVMTNRGATSSISFSTSITPRNLKDNL